MAALGSEKSWSDLPEELLSLIKFHLFAGDLNAFNGVCKSWRSAQTLVRPLPPPTNSPFRSSPCLIYLREEDDMCVFYHPIYNDFFTMDIPELYGVNILSSKHGWLLVTTKEHSLFFFNPFTREKIELPTIRTKILRFARFTSPPTSHGCLVYGIWGTTSYFQFGVLQRGQQSWRTEIYAIPSHEFSQFSGCTPLLLNGKLYALGMDMSRDLLVSDYSLLIYDYNDVLKWKVLPRPRDVQRPKGFYLGELDGRIMVAFLCCDDRVRLFSLNLTEMGWQQHQSIGDLTMYADPGSTFFRRAVVNGMSNKLYFPIFSGENGVFYSLSTKKYHSFAGSVRNEMMTSPQQSAWIEPSFESVGCGNLTW